VKDRLGRDFIRTGFFQGIELVVVELEDVRRREGIGLSFHQICQPSCFVSRNHCSDLRMYGMQIAKHQCNVLHNRKHTTSIDAAYSSGPYFTF